MTARMTKRITRIIPGRGSSRKTTTRRLTKLAISWATKAINPITARHVHAEDWQALWERISIPPTKSPPDIQEGQADSRLVTSAPTELGRDIRLSVRRVRSRQTTSSDEFSATLLKVMAKYIVGDVVNVNM